jgi:hypothetical protein
VRLHVTYEFGFLFLHLEVGIDQGSKAVDNQLNAQTYLLSELLELSAFLLLYVLICFQGPLFDFDNQDNIFESTCLHAPFPSFYRM